MLAKLKRAAGNISWAITNKIDDAAQVRYLSVYQQYAKNFADKWANKSTAVADTNLDTSENGLRTYFEANKVGNGIWKWEHYFDVYHRHLQKFKGKEVHILEIGVYSGGSLKMWQSYFGPNCKVYGIDIFEDCKVYETDGVKIFIGDQENRSFWKKFKSEVPKIDIIIDDGGHTAEQQRVTIEEMLPFLSPGGVFICEDLHGKNNLFVDYVAGLQKSLNAFSITQSADHESIATPFQSHIESIHSYPYIIAIEKAIKPKQKLIAPKHGTSWQPIFDKKTE